MIDAQKVDIPDDIASICLMLHKGERPRNGGLRKLGHFCFENHVHHKDVKRVVVSKQQPS